MIERAIYQNGGAFIALASEVGEHFFSSDCLFDGSIHRREQPALVIIARYPLNQAVVISRKGRQLPREKRIYIILPACHATGGRLSVFFTSSRRRHGLCLNARSYGRPQFFFRTVINSPHENRMVRRASQSLHCFRTTEMFPVVHRARESSHASQIPQMLAKYRGSGVAGRRV